MPTRLARGQHVGDRYRLDHELGTGERGVTWEAVDERLDRAVALRVFNASGDRSDLIQRAGVAASLTHPRVVRVFDTGVDAGRFFTVSELLPTSLVSVRLPLSSANALNTAIDVAEALQYAHERGVVHGNLHEGNVLLSESGAKVGDFALGTSSRSGTREDDLRGFGEILARISDDQDGAGIAGVVQGLRSGSYTSATDVLNDLRGLRPAPAVREVQRPARRIWPAVVIAVLVAVGAFGATRLGRRGGGPDFVPGGKIQGTPLSVAAVSDYDPPPGDGREGHPSVSNIHDGQATTFWTTERYITSADFSGRKKGVGVIFDMGTAVTVGKAQVLFAQASCNFEIRFTDNRGAPVDEWPTARTANSPPLSAAFPMSPHTARYWLLWITKLTKGAPGGGNAWSCAVSEFNLYAP